MPGIPTSLTRSSAVLFFTYETDRNKIARIFNRVRELENLAICTTFQLTAPLTYTVREGCKKNGSDMGFREGRENAWPDIWIGVRLEGLRQQLARRSALGSREATNRKRLRFFPPALRRSATVKVCKGFRKDAMLKALRTPATLLNTQLLASRTPSSSLTHRVAAHAARSYATETPLPSANSVGRNRKGEEPEGPLRPHLGVAVNPNHGLWSFFRKTVGKDGAVAYETLEAKDDTVDYSGAFLLRPGCSHLRLASYAEMQIAFRSLA